MLIILGSYRLVFDSISYDTDTVNTVESKIKLELPKQIKIATNKIDSYNVSYAKIVSNESRANFEQELKTNHLWQNELSFKVKSLLPFDIQYETETFDYFVFYNETRNEYNIYPSDGDYECIFIAYDCELQRLIILDDYKIKLN